MKEIKKVAGINLLILLVYMILLNVSIDKQSEGALVVLLFAAIMIGFHVFACLVVGVILMVRNERQFGKAFLLSAFIVLIIGFSSCFGSTIFFDESL